MTYILMRTVFSRPFLASIIIVSLSTIPSIYAGEADGVFGDYFRRMIGPCTPLEVLTGFDASPSLYGTRQCRPLKDVISTVFGGTTGGAGEAMLGFNPDGSPKFGPVLWKKSTSNNDIYYNDGRVEIGPITTPTPSVKLDVAGQIQGQTEDGRKVYIGGDMSDDMEIGSRTPGLKQVTFYNYSVPALMDIAADNAIFAGNVGIHQSHGSIPLYPLHLQGTLGTYSTAFIPSRMNQIAYYGFNEWAGGIQTYDILANAIFGNTAKFQSSVQAASFLYTSDRRLKSDITPITHALEQVTSLNGYTFTWRDSGRKDMGLIAQEIEHIFPELVHTDPNTGYKSVEYANLVGLLIESTKELSGKNTELKKLSLKQSRDIEELREIIVSQQKQINLLRQSIEALKK